jgi:hypothetical protein
MREPGPSHPDGSGSFFDTQEAQRKTQKAQAGKRIANWLASLVLLAALFCAFLR